MYFMGMTLSFVYVNMFPDPLHPHDSGYLRTLFRRKFTTISTFGESIGFLIDAVDNLIVNYVNGFQKDLDKQRTS